MYIACNSRTYKTTLIYGDLINKIALEGCPVEGGGHISEVWKKEGLLYIIVFVFRSTKQILSVIHGTFSGIRFIYCLILVGRCSYCFSV